MTRRLWPWFPLGWVLLLACAGASTPSSSSFALESGDGVGQEAVALAPRFRFPRPAKPPASGKPPPAPRVEPPPANKAAPPPPSSTSAEKPSPASPAQTASQQKPAASSPTAKGFLDPKLARSLFDQGLAEAKKLFPHLHGRAKQKHHVHPKYLDGPEDGPTVDLDPAYHQLITNAFRKEYGYGRVEPLSHATQQEIMRKVYSRYPLPGIHF